MRKIVKIKTCNLLEVVAHAFMTDADQDQRAQFYYDHGLQFAFQSRTPVMTNGSVQIERRTRKHKTYFASLSVLFLYVI